MRFVLHLIALIAVALGVGFGLSWYALAEGRQFGAFRFGPWASWPQAGSNTPDPYTRAHMAREGTLQLGQSEGLQFIAETDNSSAPLTRNCSYTIRGTTPVATFWTLVALDEAGVNIARPDGPPALHSARIARAPDGSLVLHVSRTLSPQNWLEITGEGPFSLALTFYDTAIFGGFGPSVETLPTIERGVCL